MKKQLLIILSFILIISCAAGCSVNVSNTVNNETNITINNAPSESEAKTVAEASSSETSTEKTTKTTTAKTTKKASATNKASTTKKAKATTKAVPSKKKTTTQKASQTHSKAENICYITIECKSILSNSNKLKEGHESFVPKNGIILEKTKYSYKTGSTVYDILENACTGNSIKLSSRNTVYGIYVSGINNLDEFDCGSASGWVYTVNSKSPPKSCDKYTVSNGDDIIFKYVC